MQSEFKQIDNQINFLKKKLQELPAGKLICSKNQSRYKWYQSDGHSKTYIPKANRKLADWMNSPYEHNPYYSERANHDSISGNTLRSKAESMIDMLLYIHHIPFRYESPLQLKDKVIYPDFTIRHPQTGEFYYWEHFGMMDDPTYSKNAYLKLQQYNACGIVPSIQLITTYETSEHPLSTEQIQKIIEYYFL